jgi:hypothetical protein
MKEKDEEIEETNDAHTHTHETSIDLLFHYYFQMAISFLVKIE